MNSKMFSLNNLPKNTDKTSKRIGRGNASKGTYSGRGQKGQKSRSGGKSGLARLAARDWVLKLPKMRGFKTIHTKPAWINVSVLAERCADMKVITPGLLKKSGIIDSVASGVKILGSGPIKKTLHVKGFSLSVGARKAIEDAGGKIENVVLSKTIEKSSKVEENKAKLNSKTPTKK